MSTTPRQHEVSPMDFSRDILDIKVAVQRIESTMVPRAEIEADMNRRITQDVYQADKQGMLDRLIRLETSPQRMLGWIGAVVGCLGVVIAGAGFTFSVAIYLITHK
jgi:hypothetical protein